MLYGLRESITAVLQYNLEVPAGESSACHNHSTSPQPVPTWRIHLCLSPPHLHSQRRDQVYCVKLISTCFTQLKDGSRGQVPLLRTARGLLDLLPAAGKVSMPFLSGTNVHLPPHTHTHAPPNTTSNQLPSPTLPFPPELSLSLHTARRHRLCCCRFEAGHGQVGAKQGA
jgi:hypothetical protein